MIRDTSAQDTLVQQPRPVNKTIVVSLTAVALVALTYFSFANYNADYSVSRESIRTALVERGTFERLINATGRVVATNSPSLYSTAAGRVTFLKQPGEGVSANEIVAKIDSPELLNLLEQEKNKLQGAELNMQRKVLEVKQQKLTLKKSLDVIRVNHMAAVRELKRADASFKIRVISEFDHAKAKDNLLTAELNLDNAQQETVIKSDMIDFELKTIQIDLARQALVVKDYLRQIDQLVVRSPVTGIIGNWIEQQDNKVAQNQPLLTVVDLSAYEGELEIPQTYANELRAGMTVNIRVGNEKLKGQLRSVSPEVQDNSVKARVSFIDASAAKLRQNQHLSVSILLEQKSNAIQVKRGAFTQAGDLAYVIKDGLAHRQPISIGSRSLDTLEIIAGLQPGDEIIISSVAAFEDQKTVYINN